MNDERIGVDELLARERIRDLIGLQARATDRGDLALLESVWHPGATVDVGFFDGPASEYCPMIIEVTGGMELVSHNVGSPLIELRGEEALAETYVLALTTLTDPEAGRVSELTSGRYLDRFAYRDGRWGFTSRQFVRDGSARQPASGEVAGTVAEQGRRYPDDPLYAFLRR